MSEARRQLLSSTDFGTILAGLKKQGQVTGVRVQSSDKRPRYVRVVASVVAPTQIIDLFHNGASGLRAQFWFGPAVGLAANDELVEAVFEMAQSLGGKSSNPPLFEASVAAGGRAWIKEGAWLYDYPLGPWCLEVDSWRANRAKFHMGFRFEASWALLTPDAEDCLEVKGRWTNPDDFFDVIDLKPTWANEVHEHGFS